MTRFDQLKECREEEDYLEWLDEFVQLFCGILPYNDDEIKDYLEEEV